MSGSLGAYLQSRLEQGIQRVFAGHIKQHAVEGMGNMSAADQMFDSIEWTETGNKASGSDIPHATHSGVLEIAGFRLRAYRLSNGMNVFDADDAQAFFAEAVK